MTRRISIIFRALNEEAWFDEALTAVRNQVVEDAEVEIILVDSGSTDRTIEIAEGHGCRIIHIPKSKFTFGRSLNWGCREAQGDTLVMISAHCIPQHERWLANLVAPLWDGVADYTYGRQIGNEITKFSERRIFQKYFPDFDRLPQEDFFCNNANSAILTEVWRKYQFDEEVTGLEDMVLARQLTSDGGRIGYVSDAPVIHVHDEDFRQVSRRYYREALTLRDIMPNVHLNFIDFMRYTTAGIFYDLVSAAKQGMLRRYAHQIFMFRFAQYWGSYRGHNEHRKLSRAQKESYYYPKTPKAPVHSTPASHNSATSTETGRHAA